METKNEDVKRTKEENEVLMSKILEGLEISYRKLLERKKRNNEELVIMKDNRIVRVKPEDIMSEL